MKENESIEEKTWKTTKNGIRKNFYFSKGDIKINDYGLIFDIIKYCVSQKTFL